jgi:glycosyltransferase involved in cell wall biosynthesis
MPPRPLRVAHVITDLDLGGAEVTLERLLPRLTEAGVESIVVCLSTPGPLADRIRERGTPVVELNLRPGRPNPLALVRLWSLLRGFRPDLVQTWLYHADLAGLLAGLAARVPHIVWNIRCAELDPRDHPRSLPMLLRALAFSSRIPDAVICNSEAGRLAHERLGYLPRRWEIIPNGFDTDRFKPSPDARRRLRSELGLPEETPLVGLLARYHPMKDHITFLRATRVVADHRPDVHFVAAGRGVAENVALNDIVRDLGLTGRVHLSAESTDAAGFLAGLDLAVSSSYSEAFPNVVAEAMACGTPCVVTDVGASAAIVGATGVVVPPRDPAALAAGMLQELARPAAARAARGEAARARVLSEYSLDAAVVRYRQLYEVLTFGQVGRESSACAE